MLSLTFKFRLFLILSGFYCLILPVAAQNLELKYQYQHFNFPYRPQKLEWQTQSEVFYQGLPLKLQAEELAQISSDKLEIRTKSVLNLAPIQEYLKTQVAPLIYQEASKNTISLIDQKVKIEPDIKIGRELNLEISALAIAEAIQKNIKEVHLEVKEINPQLTISPELQKKGIKEVISVGESNFSGSSTSRIHNIHTAMNHFEGQIIPPQSEFSFNNLLGKVDGSTGYKLELVIRGDETPMDWGGGVCQVSSTIYRSVLLAGYPILERTNHSYAVNYYTPHGSDATIYPGVRDFRFKNNSDTSILIHTYTEGTRLFFVLLGSKDSRKVDIWGPYVQKKISPPATRYLPSKTLAPGEKLQISKSHMGLLTTWYRKVNDQVEKIVSYYEPRPEVYKVGGIKEATNEMPNLTDSTLPSS